MQHAYATDHGDLPIRATRHTFKHCPKSRGSHRHKHDEYGWRFRSSEPHHTCLSGNSGLTALSTDDQLTDDQDLTQAPSKHVRTHLEAYNRLTILLAHVKPCEHVFTS